MPVSVRTVLLHSSAALTAAVLALAPDSAHACGVDPYIGEVCFFASPYCPEN